MTLQARITTAIQESLKTKEQLLKQVPAVEKAISLIISAFKANKKLLIAGNGGSASDAQHIAAEFVVRYTAQRRALPAIALTADSSVLTAAGNDLGFEQVFERQVEALGQKGDVFIGLTTSGTSPNMIRAFTKAQELGMKTILFLGRDGGALKHKADVEFIIQGKSTSHIQECHEVLYHSICEEVEKEFVK